MTYRRADESEPARLARESARIAQVIQERRSHGRPGAGVVVCDVRPRAPAPGRAAASAPAPSDEELRGFVAEALARPGEAPRPPIAAGPFQPLHLPEARDALARMIQREPAPGHAPISEPEARNLARLFLGLVGPGGRFYLMPPLGFARFEDGVLGVDGDRIGLLWIWSDGAGP